MVQGQGVVKRMALGVELRPHAKVRSLSFLQWIILFRTVYRLLSAIDCGPLPVLVNGSSSGDSTLFPSSVTFYCDPGFFISGSTKRACRANGTWNGFVTSCSGRFMMHDIS